jgi:hypothetical protein
LARKELSELSAIASPTMLCTPLSLANCASICPPLLVLGPKHARWHNIHARTHASAAAWGVGSRKEGGFGGVYFSWMASFSASLPTPSVSFLRAWPFVGAACVSVEGGSERLREGSWRDVGVVVVVAGETLASDEPELKRLHQYVTFGSGLLSATT